MQSSKQNLMTLLAVAEIASLGGCGIPFNSEYQRSREKQRAEQAKALAKKQRVREEIRARKAARENP